MGRRTRDPTAYQDNLFDGVSTVALKFNTVLDSLSGYCVRWSLLLQHWQSIGQLGPIPFLRPDVSSCYLSLRNRIIDHLHEIHFHQIIRETRL